MIANTPATEMVQASKMWVYISTIIMLSFMSFCVLRHNFSINGHL